MLTIQLVGLLFRRNRVVRSYPNFDTCNNLDHTLAFRYVQYDKIIFIMIMITANLCIVYSGWYIVHVVRTKSREVAIDLDSPQIIIIITV